MTSAPQTKILIADDLRSSRMNIQNLLRHWGYDPVPCEDGIAARDALAAPDGPRIAILDWVMPGMTGPEVCKWIVDEFGTFVYTILLTSKGEQRDLVEGLTSGAHAYITKPARPAELESWIRVGLRMLDYEKELSGKSEALGRHAREMEALADELAHQLAETGKCDALAGLGAGLGIEIRLTTDGLLQNLDDLDRCWNDVPLAEDSDRAEEPLAALRRGLGHLQRLANNLETFNRQVGRSAEPRCRVNDVIRAAVNLCETSLATVANVQLTLDPKLPDAPIVPDVLLRAITQYLLGACAEFRTGGPGHLGILSRLADGKIAVLIESSAPLGSEGRSNAGLTADLEIIEQLGAQSTLEMLPEGGTRLSITLPAAGADA